MLASAIQSARDIYAQVNLGISRIQYCDIFVQDAKGYDIIDSLQEARDLTNEWTVYNDAIDVFFVREFTYDDDIGLSAVDGPCNKDETIFSLSTGSVVSFESFTLEPPGIVLAHEVGHYLGLSHYTWINLDTGEELLPDAASNLMYPHVINESIHLTPEQGEIMRTNLKCFVKDGC